VLKRQASSAMYRNDLYSVFCVSLTRPYNGYRTAKYTQGEIELGYPELLACSAVDPTELCRGRLDSIFCIEIVRNRPKLPLTTWVIQPVLHNVLQLGEDASTTAAGWHLETRERRERSPIVSRVRRL
jgi:hypothetical protein